MRRAALAVVLTLLLPAAAAAQQRVERRWPAARDVSLRIYNLAGSTRVVGGPGDSVIVTGTLAAGARFFGGGSPDGIKLGIESGAALETPPADLVVRVPAGARVWIKSGAAPVEVEGVTGELELSSVTGDLRITGSPRQVSAESMDGAIVLTGRPAVTRLKTASGDITLRGTGGDVTATSVGGRVRVLEAHRLMLAHLESVSGGVELRGTLLRGGLVEIRTHDAPVELALPSDVSGSFDLLSFHGRPRSRLGPPREGAAGERLRFVTGGGGARVTVRSFRGDVVLRPM